MGTTMPTGPNGEKRPADPVANALLVARIAVGDAEEKYIDEAKSAGGRKGAEARAAKLSAERRREIAVKANGARWVANGAKLEKGHPDTPTPRIKQG